MSQEISQEELEADDADKVISVFHFSKEVSRTHGVPFRFVVKPVRSTESCLTGGAGSLTIFLRQNEKFYDTKKRLQARMAVSDKDFAKYRFALIQVLMFKQPSYIEDGMCANFVTYRILVNASLSCRGYHLRPQVCT